MVKEFIHTKRAHKGNNGAQYGYNNNRSVKNAQKERAARGQFDYDVINGFRLKEVEFKTPPKKEVRPAFLKYVAEHFPNELRAMGISDAGLASMRKG